MEPPTTEASSELNLNTRLLSPNLQQTDLRNSASQQGDGQMNPPMNPPSQNYNNNHSIVDTTRHKRTDPPKESYSIVESTRHKRSDPSTNSDCHKLSSDQKHCGLSWSVLKHRQADSVENCDKPCVLESSDSRPSSDRHSQNLSSKMDCSSDTFNKAKRNAKGPRSFPISLMKPKMASERKSSSDQHQQTSNKTDILRQRAKLGRFSSDELANPLSAIEQIKTEESIQEWLARISESVGPEDGERSAWGAKKERQQTAKSNKLLRTETANVLNKGLQVRK